MNRYPFLRSSIVRAAARVAVVGCVLLAPPLCAQSVVPQGALPQAAARDMSRVVVPDTAIIAPPLLREFRGAWVSPAGERDWPSRPGLSAAAQEAELLALIERAKTIGLNAIIFHVRLSGDAIYETPLAPWSAKLMGVQGAAPGYDPLAFVIREAHQRGLQVHAWFNPFRASLDGGIKPAPNHVTKQHPSWVRRYGREQWIDPGIPDARASVLAVIEDVVKRYDVDGIHVDDFFYPYRETKTVVRRVGKGKRRHTVTNTYELEFPDNASWARYGRGKWRSRDDWRRHNIDDFMQNMYTRVHTAKPWVAVGVSPFGIWRPGFPAGVDGLDAYREIFADSRKWLREGWADYFAPQLYWPIGGTQDRFRVLDAWWRTQNPKGRHLWPGLYTEGTADDNATWAPDEITRQIGVLRAARAGTIESNGHVHFRLGSMGMRPTVVSETYRIPALVPEMPWLGGSPPAMPFVALAETGTSDRHVLLMAAGDSTPLASWVVQTKGADGRWSLSVVPATTRQLTLGVGSDLPEAVVVTAIDRAGQESRRAVVRVRRASLLSAK